MTGTIYKLEVNPQIPERLARLEELANNLWYSWDSHTRSLFSSLSHPLWQASNHNPKIFLKRADQKKLEAAAENPIFQGALDRVLAAYDSYHERPGMAHVHGHQFKEDDLIAYFCAEFGFHYSLPIYSGGLGILAGDHCKAASDMGLPFIGIGLLYRQGYFQQTLDANGQQQPIYNDSDFDDLPVSPVLDAAGEEVLVKVDFPGRTVQAKVWEVRVGHVRLVLLDTWLPQNSEHDREITHRLYGGDKSTRIEQEILLGVGGARALAALGLKPTVWHVNEGHAAFLILERMRSLISKGMPFEAALEAVAANMVFTTHTPVPAGHDHFSAEMIRHYFSGWCYDLGLPWEQLMALGAEPGKPDFNMTALALRGSRHHNGVSRIHGDVSSDICSHLWPQIEPAENPMDYVTNGVHLPTFLAADWYETFERYLGIGWQVAADRTIQLGRHLSHSRRHLLEHSPAIEVTVAAPGARIDSPATPAQPGLASAPRPSAQICRSRQPEHPDHRLRPPLRHLQARRAAFPGPGMATRNHLPGRSTGALPVRRQGAPGRPAGPGNHPQDRRDGQVAGIRGTHPAASKATTCTWRARWYPASTSGSTTRSTRSKPPAPQA